MVYRMQQGWMYMFMKDANPFYSTEMLESLIRTLIREYNKASYSEALQTLELIKICSSRMKGQLIDEIGYLDDSNDG